MPEAPAEPASTLYVAASGSDGATCTSAAPCASFNRAYQVAKPGAVVEVAGGNYPAQTIVRGQQSPNGPAITFRAAPGQTVTVQGILRLGPECCAGTPSYLTFDGINIKNGCLRIRWDPPPAPTPTGITYKNAHIYGTQDNLCHLINAVGTDSLTISNVELGPACCGESGAGDAMELGPSTGAGARSPSNVLIDRVYVHDMYDTCRSVPAAIKAQYGCDGPGYSDAGGGGATPLTTTLASDIDSSQTTLTVTDSTDFPQQHVFTVTVGSEHIRVNSRTGNTWNVTRGSSSCGASTAASHSAGATMTVCNANGYDHIDGIQANGCNTCTLSNNRFYAINPRTSTVTGAAQDIHFQSANSGTFSNLTFTNNMLSCGCGSLPFNLAGPGTGVFSGYLRFYYNTLIGTTGIVIYDTVGNKVLAPGTTVEFVGNILPGSIHDSFGDEDCTFTASDGSTITPRYRNNLVTPAWLDACDASNVLGSATVVSTDFYSPDLHLRPGSRGISGGETKLRPHLDIDGKLRPRHAKPDIGASQREAASILPGRSLGAVALGAAENDVLEFYGSPRRTRYGRVGDRVLRVATYRLHRGELAVAYHGTKVIGVATTSPFYSTHSGLAVGSRQKASTIRPLVSCRRAYRLSVESKPLYLTVARYAPTAKISRIWIVQAGYGTCWGRTS